MRLAAIEALAGIRPAQVRAILDDLTDSEDEEIVEAAIDSMLMIGDPCGDDPDEWN